VLLSASRLWSATLAAGSLLIFRGSAAQTATCTYDRCALRLQYRLFSTRVVQGAEATPVARLGLFAPHISPLETSADTIQLHYQSFRSHRNAGVLFVLLGVAAGGAALIVYSSDIWSNNDRGTATGLLLLGTGFTIAGTVNSQRSADELQQAIWLYNRSLTTAR